MVVYSTTLFSDILPSVIYSSSSSVGILLSSAGSNKPNNGV